MVNDTLLNIVELPAQALQESATALILALPKIITALLILLLGWVVAKISEVIIKKLMTASQIDEWLKKMKLKESLYNISVTNAVSLIVKYYIIIIFLKEAAVRTSLTFLAELFDGIIRAIPEVSVGAGIIIIAMVFADFVRKKIKSNAIPFNETIAEIVYGIILFFAVVMALPKFGLTNTSLLEDTFKYIVLGVSLGISLAIGIGFGWAIKEGPAKSFFKKKRK
ncbi:MAG: hypothetical protein WC307_02380 [Candidatus Nanoarchaeia archaeon]|jgi:hypothetical protein